MDIDGLKFSVKAVEMDDCTEYVYYRTIDISAVGEFGFEKRTLWVCIL